MSEFFLVEDPFSVSDIVFQHSIHQECCVSCTPIAHCRHSNIPNLKFKLKIIFPKCTWCLEVTPAAIPAGQHSCWEYGLVHQGL